jgi:hypothetical protein
VQEPRIPVWVGGYWPHRSAFRRAARWDGVFPVSKLTEETGEPMPIEELQAILEFVRPLRGGSLDGFDVVLSGGTPADPEEAVTILAPYEAAGVTWWCEGLNGWRGPLDEMEERLRAGPPPPPVAA